MPTQISDVVQLLRSAILRHDEAGVTDGQLLGRFIEQRDEAAVAALVRRHGLMVWGVCRRILRTHHDAEDAFQATFLVLVRKAGSVRKRETVGNWLYGVAHQTALKARATATKQLARERQVVGMPEQAVKEKDLSCELQAVLDQELSSLPEKYRVGIVLCDLDGKTRKEAARQLGLPEGTLAGRLTRGRAMLAKRLARHGLAVTGGTLAAWMSQTAASASLPTSVLSSTMKIVTLVAAGKTVATGLVSAKVAALTEGVLQAMLISKLKTVVAVVLVLGFIIAGVTGLACQTLAAQDDKPPIAEEQVKTPQKQEPERKKETFTAWGTEIGGLQAGLGYRLGEKRAYVHGETVKLVVRVRNVSKEEVSFQYLRHFLIENPPTVVDDKGKAIPFADAVNKDGLRKGIYKPIDVDISAGQEIDLYELDIELSGKVTDTPADSTIYGQGKFSVQYQKVLGDFTYLSSVRIKLDPVLKKLATGKLELEVKEAKKGEDKNDKEAFTAWSKKVGRLQAGLGFRPGEKRAYHHGEKVTLVLRVRNPGDESDGIPQAVEFKHIWAFFVENPPTITGADGKVVQLPGFTALGLQQPRNVSVIPGKEVELYEWEFELRPKGERSPTTIHGTGKFSLQCERIVGPTSANPNHPNPTMDKLATGKLELEVKSDPPPADKKPKQKPKEGLTAWGKEVGGLQAGVTMQPGERRAYKFGEVITLGVRVRNVGKDTVKFEYVRQFLDENLPIVTNADGKTVEQRRLSMLGFHVPMEVTLEPGKEIELESRLPLRYEFRPANGGGKPITKERPLFVGAGKVSIQYEQVLGNSSSGAIKLDPTLSKLATGKIQLEIVETEKPAQNELPKPKDEKKKVYTPDEVMLEQEKARGKALDGSKSNIVTVEFKVQAVTKPTEVKVNTEKDSPYVVGHGPDDLCLHPQPPRKFEEKQFSAILTSMVVKQLQVGGIQDVGKHLMGKTIRVTGRINQHNYSGE